VYMKKEQIDLGEPLRSRGEMGTTKRIETSSLVCIAWPNAYGKTNKSAGVELMECSDGLLSSLRLWGSVAGVGVEKEGAMH
jgi:hypothetical protein